MRRIDWGNLGFKDTRGWLPILFGLLLTSVLRGIPEVVSLITTLVTENTLQILTNGNISGEYDATIFSIVFGLIDAGIVLALEISVLILMAMGSKLVRKILILFLLTNFLLKLTELVVVLVLPKIDQDFYNLFYIGLLQTFIGLAVIGPYLLVSDRVKKAFGRKEEKSKSRDERNSES